VGYIEDKLQHVAATVALEGDRTRAAMALGLQETRQGLRITGARYKTAPATSSVLNNGGGRLAGWSIFANGAPIRYVFHDGFDASADVIAVVDLANQEQETQWLGGAGVTFTEALFVEVIGAGPALGAVYIAAQP
jgi:hypothetical protein